MLRLGGFVELESSKDAVVDFGEPGDAADGLGGVIDTDLMMLNALQLLESAFGRQAGVGSGEALAHDAIEDQGDETDAGMRSDALGQAVIDRADLDFGLEHTEAALDVGQRLVAGDDLGRCEILRIIDAARIIRELLKRVCVE